MNSGEGDRAQPRPGPPIRTPSDHSPSAGSPRLIAGHHVLHRPLMPRHPPNAHKNKQNTSAPAHGRARHKDQRCSRPLCSSQPTRPPTPSPPPATADQQDKEGGTRAHCPRPRQRATPPPTNPPPPPHRAARTGHEQQAAAPLARKPPATTTGHPRAEHDRSPTPQRSINPGRPPAAPRPSRPRAPASTHDPTNGLPRKEVIQPHLPVRLPCYDFVPITSPTFDRSP